MTFLALIFLAAYAVPVLVPDLPAWARSTAGLATLAIWAIFALDYAIRLWLAQERLRYVREHLVELAVLALPLLRPLRLLRVVPALLTIHRHARLSFRGTVSSYVGGAVVFVAFLGSVAILDAERDSPEANIISFADALWWSFTTMTTVGYGDHYPTTGEGRFVAVGLMVIGIGLLGVVTASLAAWFVERIERSERAAETRTVDAIDALRDEIRILRAQLDVGAPHLAQGETSRHEPAVPVTTHAGESA